MYDSQAFPKLEFDAFVWKPVKASALLNALMGLLVKDTDYSGTGIRNIGQDNQERTLVTDCRSSAVTWDCKMGTVFPLRILIAEDNVINQKVCSLRALSVILA